MRLKIHGLRRAGVAAVAALTAGTALALLPALPAAAATTGDLSSATPVPNVNAGGTNQAAANWVIPNFTTSTIGDAVTIDVASSADTECTTNTNYVGFGAATPTATLTANTVGDTLPTVTVVTQTDPTANATDTACAANVPVVHNQLKITTNSLSNHAGDNFTLVISGITYNIGNSTPTGAVEVGAGVAPVTGVTVCTGSGAPDAACTAPASNANVVAVVATANTPAVGLAPATSSQAISNIVLTESEVAAVPTGRVCVRIENVNPPPQGTIWDPTSTPTVTATQGAVVNNASGGPNGTSSGVTLTTSSTSPIDLEFNVFVATSAGPGTYTISGLKLNTGTTSGPVVVNITDNGGACGNHNVAQNLEIASIVSVNRIGGADRYGTAAALFSGFSRACTGSSGLNAVLARGDLFADALAANYLAGSLHHGADAKPQGSGILLTTPSTLPDVTVAALRQAGVTDVFIVGQTDAVSQAVEDQLKATPAYACNGTNQITTAQGTPQLLHVTRIGGATRYDTAQLIGENPNPALVGTADLDGDSTPNPLKTAILARGDNFPDALSAGPMAFYGSNATNYSDDCDSEDVVCDTGVNAFGTGLGTGGDSNTIANGFPLFLTQPTGLSSQAQAGLLNDGIQQVIVMGGSAAIASSVDTQLQGLGMRVIRMAGTDRSDTARLAANLETSTFKDAPNGVTSTECDSDGTGTGGDMVQTCTMPVGLFYRTDIINVARGDDAGGGADALAGGPFAAGLVGANEQNPPVPFAECCDDTTGQEGPTPILLTLDPNTLGAAATYLGANATSKVNGDEFGPTPDGGITIANVFGQTAAISAATATAVQNALT